MFARFYSTVNAQVADNEKLFPDVLILMDEPDVYFHPAWQKSLVQNLINFLTVIYPVDSDGTKRNIQLCFTVNNPLTISDLPHTNVIFLKKGERGSIIQNSLDEKKMTFAANVFSLFADSFFLKDGYTGTFAVNKINKIIEELNDPQPISAERKEELRKTIQLIGEPILKNKLSEMFYEKERLFNNYEQRLSRLEKQIFKDDQNKTE